VVIAPEAVYEGTGADVQNTAVVSLASALDASDQGTVLAGTVAATGTGGVIAALRDSDTATANVSSVDAADTSAGRAVVVYALREQLSGQAGQYGVGPGATSFLPTASPTPTPTSNAGG
jgi:hypothetical protein